MSHLRMVPPMSIVVPLLAGVIAVSMTACSKDLPTGPPKDPGTAVPRADVIIAAAPTNDDFDAAEVIPGLPFTDSDNTTEATFADDDPPDCFGGETSPTVWYQFTPTEDTRTNANTIGSDYDTGLSVYTGTRGDLTQIECNDDAVGLASAVTFDALADVTYFFKVGAFGGGDGGNLVLNVSVAPPSLEIHLTIDAFASVNPTTGIAIVRGTATCSRDVSVELFSGELRQRISRAIIVGFFSASFECDGVSQWEAEVFPENGRFAGGRAVVSATARFLDPVFGESAFDDASATVRLRGAGK